MNADLISFSNQLAKEFVRESNGFSCLVAFRCSSEELCTSFITSGFAEEMFYAAWI